MKNLNFKLIQDGFKFIESGLVLQRLSSAPNQVKIERDSNGFYAVNQEIQIRYSAETCCGDDSFEVSFKNLQPKISFSGYCSRSGFLFRKVDFDKCGCHHLSLHLGDLNFSVLPFGDETIENIGNDLLIHRNEKTYLNSPINKVNPIWFLVGDEVLKVASKKYSLK